MKRYILKVETNNKSATNLYRRVMENITTATVKYREPLRGHAKQQIYMLEGNDNAHPVIVMENISSRGMKQALIRELKNSRLLESNPIQNVIIQDHAKFGNLFRNLTNQDKSQTDFLTDVMLGDRETRDNYLIERSIQMENIYAIYPSDIEFADQNKDIENQFEATTKTLPLTLEEHPKKEFNWQSWSKKRPHQETKEERLKRQKKEQHPISSSEAEESNQEQEEANDEEMNEAAEQEEQRQQEQRENQEQTSGQPASIPTRKSAGSGGRLRRAYSRHTNRKRNKGTSTSSGNQAGEMQSEHSDASSNTSDSGILKNLKLRLAYKRSTTGNDTGTISLDMDINGLRYSITKTLNPHD